MEDFEFPDFDPFMAPFPKYIKDMAEEEKTAFQEMRKHGRNYQQKCLTTKMKLL